MVPEHSTPPRPRPADIGRAMAAAVTQGGSAAELEQLVRAYVQALRKHEVPPEQALRRVKEVVGVSTATTAVAPPPAAHLADQVVAWFVAEYYRAD